MATKKTTTEKDRKPTAKVVKASAPSDRDTSPKNTVGGSSARAPVHEGTALDRKAEGAQQLAAAVPSNPLKPTEYGPRSVEPQAGVPIAPPSSMTLSSTVTETVSSTKVGAGEPRAGADPSSPPLDRARPGRG